MNWQYRDTVLVLCALAFFVTYFARVAVSPVVPFITDDFAVSNTQIGIALSGMWIAYGLSQYPSGVLADRYGEKRVILLSVGGTGVLSALAAASPVFALFFLGVVGIGAAAGLHYTVASTLLSRTYDDIGRAIGLHSLGAPAAGLLAPVATAWIGARYGWRPAIALVVCSALPVFVLFLWRVRPTEPAKDADDRADDDGADGAFLSLLARPPIAYATVVAILAMFGINGLISFLPTFLVEFHDYTPTLAGVVFSAYFVVRGGAQIGVGEVSDRFNRDTVVAGCLFLGVASMGVFLTDPGLPTIILATVLFGTATSFFAALEPKVLDGLSEAERNAGFGVFRTTYIVGGSTGSIGVGAFADALGWSQTFLILAVLFAASFAIVTANRVFGLGY
ncbi:MFS transporter [Natronolimnohabitans innermongolicus]|uniref:Major facilitator superfamily MFS_1 n=1 Tax=Natronolimnohabitans innermongolicus JCM 12255 TaxID=1227499 RepID=L9XH79_9EURY|nr:MFS transporter [Natronolimnohabitans innermongolicus]ELY61094.1 major facilitator superfamily MFS_1 [Natronolimnohabitans innermongolicus JCM 12255]